MNFDSTYDEYRWLRQQHGWCEEGGMIRSVWERCPKESQEEMLEQLRVSLERKDRYVERHGEVW